MEIGWSYVQIFLKKGIRSKMVLELVQKTTKNRIQIRVAYVGSSLLKIKKESE